MKALQVQHPGNIAIIDRHLNIPGEDEVLVAIHRAGICGSDIHIVQGSNPFTVYPRIIGHELAGEVVATGSEVRKFKKSDRVAIDPSINCGQCDACKRGHSNVCQNLEVLGVHRDGGLATHLVINASNLYKIPDNMEWDTAVLIEPFSVGANICSRLDIGIKDRVLVVGGGVIGTIALMVCKMLGAWTVVTDIDDSKLTFCQASGADAVIDNSVDDLSDAVDRLTSGEGVTAVIDAACIPDMFQTLLECAAPGGRIGILGFSKDFSAITQYEITRKELALFGSRLNNNRFPQVIEWFSKDLLAPQNIINKIHPFSSAPDILAELASGNSCWGKTIIRTMG